jgi:hypothetical protein
LRELSVCLSHWLQLTSQFWSGDLNYRLDMSDQEIWDLVEGKHWDGLLLGDQLLSDISENMSFAGFSEPPITFRP